MGACKLKGKIHIPVIGPQRKVLRYANANSIVLMSIGCSSTTRSLFCWHPLLQAIGLALVYTALTADSIPPLWEMSWPACQLNRLTCVKRPVIRGVGQCKRGKRNWMPKTVTNGGPVQQLRSQFPASSHDLQVQAGHVDCQHSWAES